MMIRVNRPATSTLEFLIAVDPSAAKLPVFRPSISARPRRRLQAPLFLGLVGIGLTFIAIAAFLLR